MAIYTHINALLESTSGEKAVEMTGPGGSLSGKAANRDRHNTEVDVSERELYISASPTYENESFQRRFPLPRQIFACISDPVIENESWFKQNSDACSKPGVLSTLKMTLTFRTLAYCVAFNAVDKRLGMSKTMAKNFLLLSCDAFFAVFGSEYISVPTKQDIKQLLVNSERRGIPSLLGTIDCCTCA